MAAAEPEVMHTGNTPEKIAEYKIIYDYSRVGHQFQKEAEMWFGYHTRPYIGSQASEFHFWRKWNDPRYGSGKGKAYMVQLGKCPILDKATGQLALSPTVLNPTLRKDEDKKIKAMFEGFRKAFADEMQAVVEADVEAVVEGDVEAEVNAEVDAEAGVEPDAGAEAMAEAMAELALVEKEKQKKS
jgi:hypothetical protein